MSATSVLFVDDDPHVVSGLRRLLHGFRREWEIDFAGGGEDALARISQRSFDVVVTDMRMPGMDGAQLLAAVRDLSPRTVRIVLSGQSESDRIFRAVGKTHQYLSKPCDPATLKRTVGRACSLRDRLPNEDLKSLVSRLEVVPSRPDVYAQVLDELESPDASIDRVGDMIASDAGMTAKIVQLVSSSFLGQPRRVARPQDAAAALGLDVLRKLAAIGGFVPMPTSTLDVLSLHELAGHSAQVAECARCIARLETNDRVVEGDAYLAGLLHNIGKVILAVNDPESYASAIALSRDKGIALWQAEMEVYGASHSEVGSYMLGLWGLPTPVVEAVSYYHEPYRCPNRDFSPLTALHAANVLCRNPSTEDGESPVLLHACEYLSDGGFVDRVTRCARLHKAPQSHRCIETAPTNPVNLP